MDPVNMRGSFAGAIGIPQFMPGSQRRYAVDFDGDQKIDLSGSVDDAIGSVANFLEQHGWQAGQPIHLTVKEFELLKRFMEHPGRVYSREQLLKEIWGYTDPQNTRTLDVHIRNLRKKLTAGGVTVETVRGIGYQLHKNPQP